MSDQKPHITASELDHILEQVQKKRADAPAAARPAQSSDADLDAILSELGVGTGKKRAPVEPILLPVPEFAHEKNDPLPEIPQPAPEKAPEPAAEPEPEPAPVEDEVPTVELPDIKAYSEAEAQKQAEERARIMEEARREAENTLHSAAGEAVLSAAREAVLRRGSQPAQEQEQAAPVTGNNLFGEVDDRFRDFFATAVIDDPTLGESGRRKKEKSGFWAKLFAKKEEEEFEDEFAQGEAGEYYEAALEEGYTGEFDAIRPEQCIPGAPVPGRADAPEQGAPGANGRTFGSTLDLDVPQVNPQDTPAPMSASFLARAIARADTFDLGAARKRRDTRAMDIDIPLDGDGTGEYEPLRRKNSGALAPEEEIGEYNRLSDAPAVAQELASMRQTRLARTVLTGVLTLFLLYLGLSARTGWLPPIGVLDPHTAPLTYLVTNFVLLAVAAFSSITTLGAGLRGLALQPTSDSFTALAVVGAALQNAALLFDAKNFDPEAVTLFAPVAALLLCGNALGKWLQIRAVCANFALASSGEEHAAAFLLEKEQLAKRLCDGLGEPEPRLLLNRPTALVKGFLRQSFSPRAADAMVQKLCWGLGGAALVCAVVAGVKGGGVISALSGLAAALSLSAPLAATLVYALPTSLMQQATSRCGAVVPGPSAVETLGSANTVLLSARELFPAGSVRLHGIKTFEKERIDIAILYAASLLSPSCETLRGVFMGMLDNNEKLLAGVENASVEIGYGFTGWIEHRRVLLGSREMMKRHDIEVPSLDYEKKYTKNGQRSPIYLAVAGKLFGMFLVSYRPDRRAAETLDSLAQSGISVLVQADDFNITAPLVAATYGIPEGTVKVLSQHEQDALETELAYRPESTQVHARPSWAACARPRARPQANALRALCRRPLWRWVRCSVWRWAFTRALRAFLWARCWRISSYGAPSSHPFPLQKNRNKPEKRPLLEKGRTQTVEKGKEIKKKNPGKKLAVARPCIFARQSTSHPANAAKKGWTLRYRLSGSLFQ